MQFYFYYAQTPELRHLPTQQERDAIHGEAWRQLRRQRPALWVRSLLLVVLGGCCGAGAARMLAKTFDVGAVQSLVTLGVGVGCGCAAVLHVHLMATALRPVYSRVIRARRSADA